MSLNLFLHLFFLKLLQVKLSEAVLRIRIRMDPIILEAEPDSFHSDKPDPHQTQHSGAVKAQNRSQWEPYRAADAYNRGVNIFFIHIYNKFDETYQFFLLKRLTM
jgi:hypothetical protein